VPVCEQIRNIPVDPAARAAILEGMSADPPLPLRPSRVHEVTGPGALGFALGIAAQIRGPVVWVREGWLIEQPYPPGLSAFVDPARLLIARAPGATDALAVAEEALRDGSVPLVLLDLTAPLTLTTGRRLQLAAQAGRSTGLCLIGEGMGSNAAETRWHAAPLAGDSTRMRWEVIKNKKGTMGAWDVCWTAAAHHFRVVSPVAQRPGLAAAPG
jgi:protein ImuA